MCVCLVGDRGTPPLSSTASTASYVDELKTLPPSVLKPFDREKSVGWSACTPPPTHSTPPVTTQSSTDTSSPYAYNVRLHTHAGREFGCQTAELFASCVAAYMSAGDDEDAVPFIACIDNHQLVPASPLPSSTSSAALLRTPTSTGTFASLTPGSSSPVDCHRHIHAPPCTSPPTHR